MIAEVTAPLNIDEATYAVHLTPQAQGVWHAVYERDGDGLLSRRIAYPCWPTIGELERGLLRAQWPEEVTR